MSLAFAPPTLRRLEDLAYAYPAFPTLWAPHCVMVMLSLRATLAGDAGAEAARNFAKRHPLSAYMLALIYTFPGGIISAALLGEPPLAVLLNTNAVAVMTAVWYLTFFLPGDVFVSAVDALRLRLPFAAMQDLFRAQLVLSGVQTIHKLHPGALLYPIVFAVCKSSGFMFVKYGEYVLQRGPARAFVVPHHSSKTCIVSAVLITLQQAGHLGAAVPVKTLFLAVCAVAVGFRLICNWTQSR